MWSNILNDAPPFKKKVDEKRVEKKEDGPED